VRFHTTAKIFFAILPGAEPAAFTAVDRTWAATAIGFGPGAAWASAAAHPVKAGAKRPKSREAQGGTAIIC
jgi:hypothetical protein